MAQIFDDVSEEPAVMKFRNDVKWAGRYLWNCRRQHLQTRTG
jgi:hypothetical protein